MHLKKKPPGINISFQRQINNAFEHQNTIPTHILIINYTYYLYVPIFYHYCYIDSPTPASVSPLSLSLTNLYISINAVYNRQKKHNNKRPNHIKIR